MPFLECHVVDEIIRLKLEGKRCICIEFLGGYFSCCVLQLCFDVIDVLL